MRLPQLEVPVFSGSYRDYPAFWTIYNSLIHSNQQLINTDKFQSLKRPAATLLGNMPVIGENYEKAVQLLDKRFNSRDYHSALCTAKRITNDFTVPTSHSSQSQTSPSRFPTAISNTQQNAEIVRHTTSEPIETEVQHVLMTATALAFNVNKMD
ncbi:hypothetical protein Aduo_012797 [Ancylostoma duodenale]